MPICICCLVQPTAANSFLEKKRGRGVLLFWNCSEVACSLLLPSVWFLPLLPTVSQLTVGRSGDWQTRAACTVTRTQAPPGRGWSLYPVSMSPELLTGTGSWRPTLSAGGRIFCLDKPSSSDPYTLLLRLVPLRGRSAGRLYPDPLRPPVPAPSSDRHGSAGARHAGIRRFRLHPVLRTMAHALHVHHLCVSKTAKLG